MMAHGTADDEATVTLKVSDLAAAVTRVERLFLDKLYAETPDHPFCRIAQEKGEWTPPTNRPLEGARRSGTQPSEQHPSTPAPERTKV